MLMTLATLRLIWWILLGVLFIGFAVTDGFDLGVATLLPFVARNETERRIMLNSIGPFWEGNQVWIILGAGAIFAAWPFVYAVAFSGAYFAVLLLLLTMGISRPVSFKYRSKLPSQAWRRFWDHIVFIGGAFPALILGILVGNILLGLPFSFDHSLRIEYNGGFLSLFSPFALWCGVTSIAMLVMHGGLYLALKSEDALQVRATKAAIYGARGLIIGFGIGGIWVSQLDGYLVSSIIDPNGFSNPLHKSVIVSRGAWLSNYYHYLWTMIAPVTGFICALSVTLTAKRFPRLAFVLSALAITAVITTVGFTLFPFILPSSKHYASSLLVWDASSSQLTLLVMLFAAIVFMPIIILYTSWVYHALRGKVQKELIENKSNHISY